MKGSIALVALVASLFSASFVHAQDVTAAVTAAIAMDGNAQQRGDRRKLAECIAARYPNVVQKVMRSQDASTDVKNGIHELQDMHCLKARIFRTVKFTLTGTYYSELAEVLLTTDYKASKLPDFQHVAPLFHSRPPEVDPAHLSSQYSDIFAVGRWHFDLDSVAECVARAVPDQVFALAQSKPDSAGEVDMFGQLRKQLEVCKVSELSPAPPSFAVRAALSENLYRLVDAARPVAHEKGEGPHA
jgi:hypothetical protein